MLALRKDTEQRLVGLVRRVSTDMQGDSLTTQLQRMRQHISYKCEAVGESWVEVDIYDLQVTSGKDSLRSPEFQRLLGDVKLGRINTVLCTEIDRICRNLRDFLELIDILQDCDVEFVSIKEQFDTTTPHGRLILTILIALAQFEREHTAERTSDAMIARAERGLWNGGQLFGFDLDHDHKGYLVPNDAEAAGVELAMEAFVEQGTIAAAQQAVNRAGFRTKEYTSRRGAYHPPREFSFTTIQHMLKNVAYIGKKRVGERLVDAVWPAIVDEERFNRVQALMAANARSKHSVARPTRHTYVLSGGLLHCVCGTAMEGRSGTGRLGRKYFYYVCREKHCRARVGAEEVEGVVLDRLRALCADPGLVARLVEQANSRQQRELPSLRRRRASIVKNRDAVVAEADRRLSEWSTLTDDQARSFATDALRQLAQRRDDLDCGVTAVDREIAGAESAAVSADGVRAALSRFGEIYECLHPHERKELVRMLVQRAEVSERRIVLELRGRIANPLVVPEARGDSRSERPIWLPDEDSNLEPTG